MSGTIITWPARIDRKNSASARAPFSTLQQVADFRQHRYGHQQRRWGMAHQLHAAGLIAIIDIGGSEQQPGVPDDHRASRPISSRRISCERAATSPFPLASVPTNEGSGHSVSPSSPHRQALAHRRKDRCDLLLGKLLDQVMKLLPHHTHTASVRAEPGSLLTADLSTPRVAQSWVALRADLSGIRDAPDQAIP